MPQMKDRAAPYTTAVTLNLTTVHALIDGLAHIGIVWNPVPFDPESPLESNGLYAWATPKMAAIYIGIGERGNSKGLKERLLYEIDGVQGAYVHGHALAIKRLNLATELVTPYAGDLYFNYDLDSTWVDNADNWSERGRTTVKNLIQSIQTGERSIYRVAEKFCIRLSIHMGDTGAPVNATHKSGWKNGSAEEVAAELVAAKLRGEI